MNLFAYSDYRLLLKDMYQERKRREPKFSYRYIALHAGFKSAGFFSQIIQGKSNISMRTALSLDLGVQAPVARRTNAVLAYTGQHGGGQRQHGIWLGVSGSFR